MSTQSIKRGKRCLEHELGRLFRESNHGHGEIETRGCATTQGHRDGGFCLYTQSIAH
jgi:hypothetical protein